MASLKGKTLFITGASRGIGLAIALRAAARRREHRDRGEDRGAASEASRNDPYRGARDRGGGRQGACRCRCDIRDEAQVARAVAAAVERFGGIDILVNNASAISLTGTMETPIKRFDLMFGINVRGTLLSSQACMPHLQKAPNPHILTLSPPLNMNPRWFKPTSPTPWRSTA